MSDMIERVAKAICNRADDEFEPNRDFWLPYARAAIEAMSEITQAMIDAGNAALSSNGVDNVEEDDALVCWQAMVNAALSQDTHSLPSSPGASKPAVETPQAPAAGTNSGDAP